MVVQNQVVGNKGFFQNLLHHRMAALLDPQTLLLLEGRTAKIQLLGALGQRG